MTAWARSSATSGRRTSMSSYRRMRQDTPSNGNRPADGEAGAEPKGNAVESSTRLPRPLRGPLAAPSRPPRGPLGEASPATRRCILSAIDRLLSRSRPTCSAPRGGPVPASSVLLIDADPASAESIATVLTGVGYSVTTSADPAEALPKVADHQIVIVDVIKGDRTGVDVCRDIRSLPGMTAIPVLCVAQSDDVEERIHFLEAGADD